MIKGADQYLNEKPFGKFLGLFFLLLSPWTQYLQSIDCPGPVVSQRLSPLTNPFAACQPPLFLVIDWYASSHCNYTMGPAGHLFCYFHHLPKNRLYLQNPVLSCATKAGKRTHKTLMFPGIESGRLRIILYL